MGKEKKDDWVRIASKSRQGRFYLFNKTTGETRWLPLEKNEEKETKLEAPLKLSTHKASKTPAQDRLKRLQHSFKLSQKTPRPSNARLISLREQENGLDGGPSTSCYSNFVAKSPKKAVKRFHGTSFPSEKGALFKCAKFQEKDISKKLCLPDTASGASKGSENEPVLVGVCKEDCQKQLVNSKNIQNIATNSSVLTNICSGIVKKIKKICKLPFNVSKTVGGEISKSNAVGSFGLISAAKLKAGNKTKSNEITSKSTTINQINEDNGKSAENKVLACSFVKSPSKSQNIPSYPRGSANSRLERLKHSLLPQQQASSATCSSHASVAIETNSSTALLLQKDQKLNSDASTDSADKTRKDEVEAMDWQHLMEEESQSDPTYKPTLVVEKSTKCLLKSAVHDDESQTMGDIIDTVNENLLRFSAEIQKVTVEDNSKWQKDFYYFVVDTNVLLKDLTFIEDLSKMKLCGTKGSLLYIPYAVLQELDKLKLCAGSKEGAKTLAVRAIKYLNSKLENNSLCVQAQSALEERFHLIDVISPDDSILNCCLQAKMYIPNLLFLTEDVNLRNKAICNNIMVSTKSDLLAKRYDSNIS